MALSDEESYFACILLLKPVKLPQGHRFLGGSSGGVVVKLLACRARGPGFDSYLAATISEISYLLLPSCDMAEILLKPCKSS